MADPPGRTPFDVFREAAPSGGIEFPRDEDTQSRALSNATTVVTPPEKPPSPLTHTYQNGSPISNAFAALRDNIVPNLTPTAPHWPGTSGPQPLFDKPIEAPFLNAVGEGMRGAVDYGAEKLARLGGAVLPSGVTGALTSPEEIRADITRRAKEYQSNPDNYPDSTSSTIGKGIGAGLVYGGPLTRLGGALTALIGRTGAASIPGVSRTLEYLGGTAEAAPGASLPARLATRGTSLGLQGAELGGTTAGIESDPSKPLLPQIGEGAATGALANPAMASALKVLGYPVKAAIGKLPGMVGDDIAPLADRFINQYGIKLDPTQLTQNPTYRLMTDQAGKLPFSGAGNRIAEARLQWQKAVANEMGEALPGTNSSFNGITHAVMDRAQGRIGAGMSAIADRTTVKADDAFYKSIADIAPEIDRFRLTEAQKNPIEAAVQDVLGAFKKGNGEMGGEAYQNLVQTGGPLDTAVSHGDPTVSAFALKVKNALDDAFQRAAAPGDKELLQTLRQQYRVMKTVQPMVEQKGLTGDIEPNGLLQRVRAQSAKFDPSTGGLAYTGGGKLGDLAYGGQIFFGKPPDSGTAARNVIMGLVAGGGSLGALAHPLVPAGTLATLAANRAAQGLLRSPAVGQSMVENSLNPRTSPLRLAPPVVPGLLDYVNQPR
jgi:hypothetical protein